MKKSTKNVFRWVSLIPGSLIAGLLVTFPLHWFLYLASAYNGTLLGFIELPERSDISIENTLYPALIAAIFILVGYKIAPVYKFKAAIALAILYALFILYTFFLGATAGIHPSFGARSIGPIAGLFIGLFISYKKAKRESRTVLTTQNT